MNYVHIFLHLNLASRGHVFCGFTMYLCTLTIATAIISKICVLKCDCLFVKCHTRLNFRLINKTTVEPFKETDIRELLKRSPNAICAVGPMPAWLLKDCLEVLISPITNIVNESLSLGVFPRSMKAAFVKPLIKNHTLDCDILNNYRPVSNLTFLSKVIKNGSCFPSKQIFNQ